MSSLAAVLVPPEAALAGLADQSLRRLGGVIYHASGPFKGKIFAHMQEAGGMARVLAKALQKGGVVTAATGSPVAGAGTIVADLSMQAGQIVQNEAIRKGMGRLEGAAARIEGGLDTLKGGMETLNRLGVANLALTGAGIGISVVGFGIMYARLNTIQDRLHGLSDGIDSLGGQIARVGQEMLDSDFLALHSLVQLYEEAWSLSDLGRSEQQWLRVAQDARSCQDRFDHRARELLVAVPPDFVLAEPMLDALAVVGGLRFSALMACNETRYAEEVASENARQINSLTGAAGLSDIVLPALPSTLDPGSPDWEQALANATAAARPLVERMREREAATATRAAPLALLARQGVTPREWLKLAREESEAPVLMLADAAADQSAET